MTDSVPARPVRLKTDAAEPDATPIGRQVMTQIARKERAPTDTSHDYEFTDWEKVEHLARAVDGLINGRAEKRHIVAAYTRKGAR